MENDLTIFWFRRDLRLEDNAGLYRALKSGSAVLPIFIFDTTILDRLDDKQDSRVTFIYDTVCGLKNRLEQLGGTLETFHSSPKDAFELLTKKHPGIKAVYTNKDYEPDARDRDEDISRLLEGKGIKLHGIKDQVIFEKGEVVKDDGSPYTVFTPYRTKWLNKLNDFYLKPYPTERYLGKLLQCSPAENRTLESLGFVRTEISIPNAGIDIDLIKNYDKTRDFPAIRGTSKLSVHLRFGTLSIRKLAVVARESNFTWLSELIWREFYQMILWHFPESVDRAFKPQYDLVQWRNNEQEFEAWCRGETGYPIVDAGMRELNETGFMHNRVRMIVASFLTKHLLIDWRWGERYFAEKLLDFDLASNVGGWQWAASSGCDAAPYFRVFNPQLQTEKFDPKLEYIRKWVPEFQELTYPRPIVDHAFARQRVLAAYKKALNPEA